MPRIHWSFEPDNCWKVLIRCFLFLPRRQRLRQSTTTTNDRRSPSSTRHFQFITQIFLLSTTKIENIAKMAATLPESEDDVPMLDEEREINSSIAPLADEHTISTTTDSAILADNVATATNKKPLTTASGVPPGELFVASPPHITLGCKVVFNCLLTLRVLDTRLFRVKFFKKIFNNNDRA
ncbi:uncharacterized protein LOC142221792 [Haematobia irritans]|uniref:uncharacterized protein LOC142221792 n=1 Tax=Haematobia irritans TaxID=7368 RepID=UPI003F4FF2B6